MKIKGKIEPLPFRDTTIFDSEWRADDLENASIEMEVFQGIKIKGMSMLFDDEGED